MSNDSENFPGLGVALETIAHAALSHKEIMGPPEVYATIYNDLSSAYMRGLETVGRPLAPSDIYALQVIEGLVTHIIRPVAPALLTAGRSAATGAGMLMAMQDAAERQAKAAAAAAEAEKAETPAYAHDSTAPADLAPAKPEDDPEDVQTGEEAFPLNRAPAKPEG